MNSVFKIWKRNRELYQEFFEKYSLEQLNETPQGFSNNLIWNIGHVLIAQQVLIYKSSGLEGYVSDDLIDRYKPGSRPTNPVSEADVMHIKDLMAQLVEKTEEDFNGGKFNIYNERTTSMGFHLATIEEALTYNNYHEALHLGYMMSIRKLV
ncbi:DinB family protein [Fulvivirga sediminis]|uniref:DinB family protein n=1 Tax=Fulvivirga sediminis TaxID=2803949 RepID=A0A937FB44_9BACT|nr:DinB family protein [Fulvivirga sediminis]MBL3658985.1 DinB family protein [Fulvivirga sediminis]